MPGFKIAIGLVLIFAGCQIPWFFAGTAGFILGDFIALYIQAIERPWDIFVNDLKYGLLGSILGLLHRRTGVVLAAGLYCAFLIRNLPAFMGWNMDWFSWQYYVIAAAMGILFAYFIKTYAIVVISSFSGAILVAQNSNLGANFSWFSVLAMVVLGVATQFILLRHYNPDQDEPET